MRRRTWFFRSCAFAAGNSFHAFLSGLALVFILIAAAGFPLAGGTIPSASIVLRAAPSILLLLGIVFYSWRRERRIVVILAVVFWSLTFGVLYLPSMYLAARCPTPFRDDLLARMDRAIGIEVPDVLRLTNALPGVKAFLDRCYNMLLYLMTAAIMLPPLCRRVYRSKEYLIACVASAILAFPLFAVLPARGPWCYYGYPATSEQEKVTQVLVALKSDDTFVLNLCAPEGLISFPSFHTVLALLAAFALWPVPYVRGPAALLAALIVLSTLTTGWHYLIDVVAGVLVATLSCALAKGYSSLEARFALSDGVSGQDSYAS
ncbi:MAG TPA: phosphatase PAP2 family protein [Gemmataceae bacterium]